MSALSAHQRIALFRRFAPVEILVDTASGDHPGVPEGRLAPRGRNEHRLHFRSHLGADEVDVCIDTGGVFLRPRIAACSMEPPGSATISAPDLVTAIEAALGMTEGRRE